MKVLQILFLCLVCALATAAQTPVTVYLAGDSTMAAKKSDKRPETGWGEMLPQYFAPQQVAIANHAMNGRSTKSFIAEGRWQAIVDKLRAGDYVFIQFGHNDESKDKAERFTPPADFAANLTRMVTETRAKKAWPVLLTPIMRRRFDKDSKFFDTHGEYPDITRRVAQETQTPLLDMHRATEKIITTYGAEGSQKLFMILAVGDSPNYPQGLNDNTHLVPLGAEETARAAVGLITASKLPLRKYVRTPPPAPPVPLSAQMAETAMNALWAGEVPGVKGGLPPRWNYEFAVVLNSIKMLWYATGERKYFDYMKRSIDAFVNEDGTIRTYTVEEYNIDQVGMARAVLLLYRVTGEAKYKKAADLVHSQLKTHPRTNEGGLWHKKIYPYQMWLDGLYMGQPFAAEYAEVFHEAQSYDDIANQFIWMENHVRDEKTGLLYHAWDESKQMPWADKTTGRAPMFWGRAIGWYVMALVDVLDYLPAQHPQRPTLITILNRTLAAVNKVQDKKSGTWYLILDRPDGQGNYLEASAACMFTYAMAKGVRLGYLPPAMMKNAERAYAGIQKEFLVTAPGGQLNLEKTIGGAGLGGKPYRDGSYEYYISEKLRTNDAKGVGAFIMAAVEMEMAAQQKTGAGRTVLLDAYFNRETKKDDTGQNIVWHYQWDELANGGFGLWRQVWHSYGARTATLDTAPTAANLKQASVYIIVDPDVAKENPQPNFIAPEHSAALAEWVKQGGVLVLLGNDTGNCDFEHFNGLAQKFGIKFNGDSRNRVTNDNFALGKLTPAPDNPVFPTARTLYLKEISTLTVTPPAQTLLSEGGDALMATAKYGKGTVFVVGDPWLYNEYTDGRKLPAEYHNFQAMQDLTRWLLAQSRRR